MKMKEKMVNIINIESPGLLLNRFYQTIERTEHHEPHLGLTIASHSFCEPYPLVKEIDLLSLSIMDLLNLFAFPSLSGYCKFTISFTSRRSFGEEITFTPGPAISLTTMDEDLIPQSVVFAHIKKYIIEYAERYEGASIVRVMIRVYMASKKQVEERPTLSESERLEKLSSIISGGLSKIEEPIPAVRKIQHGKHKSYLRHITALKPRRTELKPFLVADFEHFERK